MSSGRPGAGTMSSSSGCPCRTWRAPASPLRASSSAHSSRASTTRAAPTRRLGVADATATAGREPSRRHARSSAATVREPTSGWSPRTMSAASISGRIAREPAPAATTPCRAVAFGLKTSSAGRRPRSPRPLARTRPRPGGSRPRRRPRSRAAPSACRRSRAAASAEPRHPRARAGGEHDARRPAAALRRAARTAAAPSGSTRPRRSPGWPPRRNRAGARCRRRPAMSRRPASADRSGTCVGQADHRERSAVVADATCCSAGVEVATAHDHAVRPFRLAIRAPPDRQVEVAHHEHATQLAQHARWDAALLCFEMPVLGAHVDSSGGLHLAFERAKAMGADAIQVHPTPPGFWGSPKLDETRIATFKEAAAKYGHPPFYFHAVYLINLAGDDPTLRQRSESTLAGYLQGRRRARRQRRDLSHRLAQGRGVRGQRCRRSSSTCRTCSSAPIRSTARLLIENNAGLGGCVGARFEEIAQMLPTLDDDRECRCASTRATRSRPATTSARRPTSRKTIDELDRVIGLEERRGDPLQRLGHRPRLQPRPPRQHRRRADRRGGLPRPAPRAAPRPSCPSSSRCPGAGDGPDAEQVAVLKRLRRLGNVGVGRRPRGRVATGLTTAGLHRGARRLGESRQRPRPSRPASAATSATGGPPASISLLVLHLALQVLQPPPRHVLVQVRVHHSTSLTCRIPYAGYYNRCLAIAGYGYTDCDGRPGDGDRPDRAGPGLRQHRRPPGRS